VIPRLSADTRYTLTFPLTHNTMQLREKEREGEGEIERDR